MCVCVCVCVMHANIKREIKMFYYKLVKANKFE